MQTVEKLAKDLTHDFPRSPRETLAGYVIAGRTLDKCRADIAGTLGEYHYDCPLDSHFFGFTGIDAGEFREFVATGADDDAVADWIGNHAKKRETAAIIQWNNDLRYKRPCDLPEAQQEFLEGYIPEFIPKGKIVYTWFDVYDIEEKRI